LSHAAAPTSDDPKFNRILFEGRDSTEIALRYLPTMILVPRLQMRMNSRFPGRPTAVQAQQNAMQGRGGGMQRGGMGTQPGGLGGFGMTVRPQPAIYQGMTNSIIVQGSKRDREIVLELIELLDVPDPVYPPERVLVENSDPMKVYQELITTYGPRLSKMLLPNGMTPIVRPEPSTNCIVIQAPEDVVAELTKYIKETDERIRKNPEKNIQVVGLVNTNANVVQDLFNRLFPQNQLNTSYGGSYQMPGYGGYQMPGYGGYQMPGYGGYQTPGNYGRVGF